MKIILLNSAVFREREPINLAKLEMATSSGIMGTLGRRFFRGSSSGLDPDAVVGH